MKGATGSFLPVPVRADEPPVTPQYDQYVPKIVRRALARPRKITDHDAHVTDPTQCITAVFVPRSRSSL